MAFNLYTWHSCDTFYWIIHLFESFQFANRLISVFRRMYFIGNASNVRARELYDKIEMGSNFDQPWSMPVLSTILYSRFQSDRWFSRNNRKWLTRVRSNSEKCINTTHSTNDERVIIILLYCGWFQWQTTNENACFDVCDRRPPFSRHSRLFKASVLLR